MANPIYGLARPSHQISACIGITSFIFKLLYLGIKKAHPSLGWAFSCQHFNQAKFAMKNPATSATLTEFRWSGSAELDLFRSQELN